jgi:hypothetical protein
LILFYDKIYYSPDRSSAWKHNSDFLTKTLNALADPVQDGMISELEYSHIFDIYHDEDNRINSYLTLSDRLKAPYWPSPYRQELLTDKLKEFDIGALPLIKSVICEELFAIADTIHKKTGNISINLNFFSFATPVILNSNSIQSIIQNVLEFRRDPQVNQFKEWLLRIDNSLAAGNIFDINTALSEIQDIFSDTKKRWANPTTIPSN